MGKHWIIGIFFIFFVLDGQTSEDINSFCKRKPVRVALLFDAAHNMVFLSRLGADITGILPAVSAFFYR